MRVFAQGWSHGFDGPGRRWVYYLKGCNFHCRWCGNPESISPEVEMMFYPNRSGSAALSCPKGAVDGGRLDRTRCGQCAGRLCVDHWRNAAFELAGKELSATEIIGDVEERRPFFAPDGGVTFSGGEPSLQMDALLDTARRLRENGVHLVVESNASSPRFSELCDCVDLLICDLKCVTPELHRQITGADNRLVLANLAAMPKNKTIFRVPLIRELNFTASERLAIFQFLLRVRPSRVEFLRLHHLGMPKYEALGLPYPAENLHPVERGEALEFCGRLRAEGIDAEVLN